MQGLEGMCSGQAITKNFIAMLRGRKPKKGPFYDFSPTIFLMTLSRSIAYMRLKIIKTKKSMLSYLSIFLCVVDSFLLSFER